MLITVFHGHVLVQNSAPKKLYSDAETFLYTEDLQILTGLDLPTTRPSLYALLES